MAPSHQQHQLVCSDHCCCCCVCCIIQARTIDLCNNPKTKEPKLSAARRIIKEWPDLDAEQAAFTASVDEKYKAQEAAFAAAGAALEAEVQDSCAAGDNTCSAGDSGLGTTDHTEL